MATATGYRGGMIDLFSLGVSHGLLALTAWRLLWREDLESDDLPPAEAKGPPADA